MILLMNFSRHFFQDTFFKTSIQYINDREWFYFNSVHLLYYKCHRMNFMHDVSYIDSPDWIKKKKITNPENINDNDKRW